MLAADAFRITRKAGVVVCAKPPRVALAAGGVLDVECPPNVAGIFQVSDEVTVEYIGRKHYVTFDDPDSVNRRLGGGGIDALRRRAAGDSRKGQRVPKEVQR